MKIILHDYFEAAEGGGAGFLLLCDSPGSRVPDMRKFHSEGMMKLLRTILFFCN